MAQSASKGVSPRNDLAYLRRPYRGYGGSRERSYHSNDGQDEKEDGAPIDYSRSNVASRERITGVVAAQKGTEYNQDLLHDWKSFRENVRDKVGNMGKTE